MNQIDTELKLTEAGNKTGSADVYERLCERCNNEISTLSSNTSKSSIHIHNSRIALCIISFKIIYIK